jgi:hypothetical protein
VRIQIAKVEAEIARVEGRKGRRQHTTAGYRARALRGSARQAAREAVGARDRPCPAAATCRPK